MVVEDFPVDEEASLVLDAYCVGAIVYTNSLYKMLAESHLAFPARHISVDLQVCRRAYEESSDTDYKGARSELLACGLDLFVVEEVAHPEVSDKAEEYVISHESLSHFSYFSLRLHEVSCKNNLLESTGKSLDHFFFEDASVEVHCYNSILDGEGWGNLVPANENWAFDLRCWEFVVICFSHIICLNISNMYKYKILSLKLFNKVIFLYEHLHMKLNHNSATPLHAQAERVLREMIAQDEYKKGKLFPSEVELSEQLNISRNTLRQAINKLVYEGLLERRKGVGTKVVRKTVAGGVKNWLSFSQEMKMLGIEVRNFELHISRQIAKPEAVPFFECEDTTRCVVLERLRGNREYPFVYFVSYFNPALPITGEEDYNTPLYEMLKDNYDISVKTSKEAISARLAGNFLAEKLEIAPGDPVLVRKRFVYDENGVPVEFNIGYYRADSFTYNIEATR